MSWFAITGLAWLGFTALALVLGRRHARRRERDAITEFTHGGSP